MTPTIPLTRDLVLIGGGHAHALVLRRWGMDPLPGARLTLVTPDPTAPYTGMLPGHIAGHYPRDALEIDLVRLARHAGARLVLARAEAIDRDARRIAVAGRPPIPYDIASIDIGITADMPALPGFDRHAVPAKPLDAYATRWAGFLDQVARGDAAAQVAVIGGGAAGVELALAMAHRLDGLGATPQVTVLEAGTRELPGLGRGARAALRDAARRQGVTLRTGIEVRAVTADGPELADGTVVPAALTVGAAGARAQGWPAQSGLTTQDGFITVDATLRSVDDRAIFAAGDCAHLRDSPRPKAGVFAVRQAPVLAHNLRAALSGGALRRYRPQRDYLKLISTGDRRAVADKWGLRLQGRWLWRLKDRIDSRFMTRLCTLPAMPAPALPRRLADGAGHEIAQGKPLCTGCGAKIGGDALRAALAQMPAPLNPDLIAGPGDDAAVLRHGAGYQVLTTDHLRAVTADPWLMARIAAVHALGDIWAMGAAPQSALATVILPRMSPALQRRTLSEIMDGAGAVLRAAGADIVGGHSAMGAEFTLGFAVTGLTAQPPVTKSGARPGDALILTKPLGTGVLLVAEMAQAARAAEIARLWDSMATAQGAAAALLAPQAGAMTDVTGFGLAGHLMEILDASDCAAQLNLADIPTLPGAAARAADGHVSSIAPANRAAVAARMTPPPDTPWTELLFDPQTAGGLLACVPRDTAGRLCADLRATGLGEAAIIGEITPGAPYLTLR